MNAAVNSAHALNSSCDCTTTDVAQLRTRVGGSLQPTHDHLFSPSPVFIAPEHRRGMQATIDAVERVVALETFQTEALSHAPPIARPAQPTRGVFLGFDFHVTADGPRLIEINTNAGGALLTAAQRGAQMRCCTAADEYLRGYPAEQHLEDEIFSMFQAEWRAMRGDAPVRRVAIVDDDPERQYLYPEFLRFRQLFEARGVEALIADARELIVRDERLHADGLPIDLVYNRCTDFAFDAPEHGALAEAYRDGLAVITPHPRAHALYADKRNLALLSDETALARLGVSAEDRATLLEYIPSTRLVSSDESWWTQRDHWFFKPWSGFGSRGTYRGGKLTRRVFAEIQKCGYVAQEFTPAGERLTRLTGDARAYKVDIRAYVFAGRIQQLAARLYQGQTTNFRTEGGGFAPVYVIPSGGDVQRC